VLISGIKHGDSRPYLRARTNAATYICVNVEMSRVHAYMRVRAHLLR